MKIKILIHFQFVGLLLLFATTIWAQYAQGSSIGEGATDQQWFQFMKTHAFNIGGLDYKMPLLANELNLNDREQREVKNLFLSHGDTDNPSAETLKQVKRVRRMLGDRDLDFRFWFFEEHLIDNAEDDAYHKNHHYSADGLVKSLLKSIQQTAEFKDFKTREVARLNADVTDEKVEDYFSNWKTLLANRVLVQIKEVKRRNLANN